MQLKRETGSIHTPLKLAIKLLAVCGYLLLSVTARGQYYPIPPVVPPGQLQPLLKQAHAPANAAQYIMATNALGSLYVNLPEKRTKDLTLAHYYGREALAAALKANDPRGRSNALLLLGQVCCWQNSLADSAQQLLALADEPTRLRLLLQTSFFYWYRQGTDDKADCLKSLDYAKQAIALGEKLGEKELVLMARRNMALVHDTQGGATTEQDFLEVIKAYKQAGVTAMHYAYFGLAWYYYKKREVDKAYYYAQEAVQLAAAMKDTLALGDMYLIKSNVEYVLDNYDDAIRSAKTSLQFYSTRAGMYSIADPFVHEVLAQSYDKTGRKADAIAYTKNQLRQYPLKQMADSVRYFYRLANAHRELKQYPEAEYYFMLLLHMAERAKSDPGTIYQGLGHLYLDAGQYAKAKTYLERSLGPGTAATRSPEARYTHYMLFVADSAMHQYLDAIRQLDIVNDAAATEARLEKDKVVKQMEVKYKAREKENELLLKNQNISLLQREAAAQQEKLQQSQKINWLSAGGLALAVIIMALLFVLYRQNQRSSREVSQKNALLQKLLSEKEWLLKEVHHRVKNNLHTIYCLLESQGRMATPEARSALEKSQHRIYAMSLFHQKMYQSDSLEEVDFGNYIREFLMFLEDGFGLEDKGIRITHAIIDVVLPLNLAMPLALVANEALTNAAKYAFEGRDAGEIRLTLEPSGNGYQMTIADNGVGMPDPRTNIKRTLGMELMHGLCADIGATLRIVVDAGTQVNIAFNAA